MLIKVVDCEDELRQYLAIRHVVFVTEQRIFNESDVDEHDCDAIHIVALAPATGKVLGGVRCYANGDGSWVGGRLAVLNGHRHGRVGRELVRKAVSLMAERGCLRFFAHVQLQNVPFFHQLGWRSVGDPELFCGLPHQLMEADLHLTDQSRGPND